MDKNSMRWNREANLKYKHIKGAMKQHKGRLVILGGTGREYNHDRWDISYWKFITKFSPSDTNRLEWLSQDGKPSPQLCDPEFDPDCPEQHKGARGRWLDGVRYPLKTETHSMITTNDYLYVFGEFFYL